MCESKSYQLQLNGQRTSCEEPVQNFQSILNLWQGSPPTQLAGPGSCYRLQNTSAGTNSKRRAPCRDETAWGTSAMNTQLPKLKFSELARDFFLAPPFKFPRGMESGFRWYNWRQCRFDMELSQVLGCFFFFFFPIKQHMAAVFLFLCWKSHLTNSDSAWSCIIL